MVSDLQIALTASPPYHRMLPCFVAMGWPRGDTHVDVPTHHGYLERDVTSTVRCSFALSRCSMAMSLNPCRFIYRWTNIIGRVWYYLCSSGAVGGLEGAVAHVNPWRFVRGGFVQCVSSALLDMQLACSSPTVAASGVQVEAVRVCR